MGVDSDDASSRGIEVGIKVENRIDIADKTVTCVGGIEQLYEGGGALNRTVINSILRVGSVIDVEDEEFAVFCNHGLETQLFVVGTFVNQFVLRLVSIETVPVNAVVICAVFGGNGVGAGEAIVEKACAIVFPGDTGEPAPFKSFGGILFGIDGSDFDFLLVAAAS